MSGLKKIESLLKDSLKEVEKLKAKKKEKPFDYLSKIKAVLKLNEFDLDFKTQLALAELLRQEVGPEAFVLKEGSFDDDNNYHWHIEQLAYFEEVDYFYTDQLGFIDEKLNEVSIFSKEVFLEYVEEYFKDPHEDIAREIAGDIMAMIFKAAVDGDLKLPTEEADFSKLGD